MQTYRTLTYVGTLAAVCVAGLSVPRRAMAQASFSIFHAPVGTTGGNVVLSGDGRTIVGTTQLSGGPWIGFRWTPQNGLSSFALPAFGDAWVGGSSRDGSSFFINTRPNQPNPPRTSWIIQNQTLASVARPAIAPELTITSISRDGNWVAGTDGTHVFRKPISGDWSEIPVMVPTGFETSVQLSGDGSVVVGSIVNQSFSAYSAHSYRWTANEGVSYIHAPPLRRLFMGSISPDGSTMFGGYDPGIDSDWYPVFQRQGESLRGFVNPPQLSSSLFRYSNLDASVLLASTGGYSETYIWTQGAGMTPIASMYAAAGVNFSGYQLSFPSGMSEDARTILWEANRPSDGDRGLVLVTIPGPGAATVMLVCVGALAVRRRREAV